MNLKEMNQYEAQKLHARLVCFFYDLLRDHVQSCTLEALLQSDKRHIWDQKYNKEENRMEDDTVIFSNPFLAEYAEDIANRFFGGRTEISEEKPRIRPL